MRTFDPEALRRHAAKRGVSLATIARLLKVPRSMVSDWALGRYAPHPRHLVGLAQALKIAPQQLTTTRPATAELYDLRVWTGQSIRAVGAAAQIPWQSIAAIEAGTRPLPQQAERIERLAEALSTTPAKVRRAAARTQARRQAHRGRKLP